MFQNVYLCYPDIAVRSCLLLNFSNSFLVFKSSTRWKPGTNHQHLNPKSHPRVFLIASLTVPEWRLSYITGCIFWSSSCTSISLDGLYALGHFSRTTSKFSSVCVNISRLFKLSHSFKVLFTFQSPINWAKRVAFLSELWFIELSVNNLSWIILPLISNLSICPYFDWLRHLSKVSTVSFAFDVKGVF